MQEPDFDKKDLNDAEHIEELAGLDAYDDSIEDAPPSRAVWLITFTVAMGGFLFGEHIPLATSLSRCMYLNSDRRL